MSQNLKILIISEYVAPVQSVASIRWTKYAKYLKLNHKCDITILTNSKSFKNEVIWRKRYALDNTAADDLSLLNLVTVPLSIEQIMLNCIFNVGRLTLSVINDLVVRFGRGASKKRDGEASAGPKKSAPNDSFLSSIPVRVFEIVDAWCGRAIVRSSLRAAVDWRSFDVVISTYSPIWTHQIASKIKTHVPHIFWVADFRDPIVNSQRVNTTQNRLLAYDTVKDADAVISVSAGTSENLFLPKNVKQGIFVNGFDPQDSLYFPRQTSDYFDFIYTGMLHSDSTRVEDLSPLFEALTDLGKSGEVDLGVIRVVYAGSTSHLFLPYCNSYPSVTCVDRGLLSRKEALKLQSSASVLLVASWNNSVQTGVLTGKVFEYLAKDVPILGLCSGDIPQSDLKRLIEEDCNVGICYEEACSDDFLRLKEFIRHSFNQWRLDGITSREATANDRVTEYSYPILAGKLLSFIEENRHTPETVSS